MQFLTVSDEIVPSVYSLNIKERFRDVQCALGCGDLPFYYLEFIITTLAIPCYYVLGNHDHAEQTASGEQVTAPRGCVSLEGRSERIGGLIVAGLGGCVRYNRESGPQFTETEMLIRLWRLAPRLALNRARFGRYVDVMLTHAPPHGIHNGPDRPHRGFQAFLTLMDLFRPRYLIHGHIHRSYNVSAVTETQYRDTLVLNTAGHRVLRIDPPEGG